MGEVYSKYPIGWMKRHRKKNKKKEHSGDRKKGHGQRYQVVQPPSATYADSEIFMINKNEMRIRAKKLALAGTL